MNEPFKIVTILGSPHDAKSNTRAFVEDFVQEIALAGIKLEHTVIPLGRKKVNPCKGCWNCTKEKPCPLDSDDLPEIKRVMVTCDMLIMASPVYTNQITAQMKALFDRLFTWCHIFPLLGKYSLAAVTTGGEGTKPTADFLEKMLATFGTFSFGRIETKGGFTPGFFPLREKAKEKNRKLAQKAAFTIQNRKQLPVSSLQKKMYNVMYKKMSGVNLFRYLTNSEFKSEVAPSPFKLKMMRKILSSMGITDEDIEKISKMMAFEYKWWIDRGWLKTRSFKQLSRMPVPGNFNILERLTGVEKNNFAI